MSKPQIIYDDGQPAFAVIPYEEYLRLTGKPDDENELIPFQVGSYVENPVKAMRIEAGIRQEELADRLGVSQGYISKIERRSHKVTGRLMARVEEALKAGRR
ncbi:helix-turn-helix domain-containing protein [Endothiovibrio diazotrophicus]